MCLVGFELACCELVESIEWVNKDIALQNLVNFYNPAILFSL